MEAGDEMVDGSEVFGGHPKSKGVGLAATVKEWCDGQEERRIQDGARRSDGREDSSRAQTEESYKGG